MKPFLCFLLLASSALAQPPVRLPGGAPPPTPEEIILGQRLFNSPLLSVNGTVSCATCHTDVNGGADANRLAIGINGRVGIFNTPTVFDAVYPPEGGDVPRMFHNARTASLGTQSLEPIIAINEMGNAREVDVLARIYNDASFRASFSSIFGEKAFVTTQVPVTQTRVAGFRGRRSSTVTVGSQPVVHVNRDAYARAFTAFESTLVTPHNSPYDKWMAGDRKAMTPAAVMGLGIFFASNCQACHTPPLFKDRASHNNGMNFASTRTLSAVGDGQTRRFMTANLRRAAETPPYGFDGSYDTLERVIDHYDAGGFVVVNNAVQRDPLIDPAIRPLGLTPTGKTALIEFIRSLSPEPGTSPRIALP